MDPKYLSKLKARLAAIRDDKPGAFCALVHRDRVLLYVDAKAANLKTFDTPAEAAKVLTAAGLSPTDVGTAGFVAGQVRAKGVLVPTVELRTDASKLLLKLVPYKAALGALKLAEEESEGPSSESEEPPSKPRRLAHPAQGEYDRLFALLDD